MLPLPVSFRVILSRSSRTLPLLFCLVCFLLACFFPYSNLDVKPALVHAITFIKRCTKPPLPLYLFFFSIITGDS